MVEALKALDAFIKNPSTNISDAHMKVLSEMSKGTGSAPRAVFMVRGRDVDIHDTLEAVAFCDAVGEGSGGPEFTTLDAILEKGKPTFPACPITRRALRNGRTVTTPQIDWSDIPPYWRQVAGYGAELRKLGASLEDAEQIVYTLRNKGCQVRDLPPPWPALESAWGRLLGLVSPSPDEYALIQRVKDRCFFKAGTLAPAPAPSSAPAPTPAPTQALATAPGAGHILIVSAKQDSNFAEAVKKTLYLLKKRGVESYTWNDIIPGAGVHESQLTLLSGARLVLLVLSSDLLCEDDTLRMVQQTRATSNIPVIPIFYRPTLIPTDHWLDKLSGLPRSGKPIAGRDWDGPLAEVSQEIRAILG